MPLTKEQIKILSDKATQQKNKKTGLTAEQKKLLLQKAEQRKVGGAISQISGITPLNQSTKLTNQQPKIDQVKKNSSLISKVGGEIAKSFLTAPARVLTSVANVGETMGDLGRAGGAYITGDKQKALKLIGEAGADISESRNFPIVGKVKPVGLGGGYRAAADILGTGGDIGTSLIGGGTAGKLATGLTRKTLGTVAKEGSKIGLKTGVASEMAQVLQRIGKKEEKGVQQELANVVLSGLVGATAGGTLGVGSELTKRIGKVAVREITPITKFLEKKTGKEIGKKLFFEEMGTRVKDLGIDEKTLKIAKKSGDDFKKDALKIIDQTIQRKENSNVATPLQTTIGKKLEKDLGRILSLKDRAGQSLSKAKKALDLSKDEVDLTSVSNKFMKRLVNSKVKVDEKTGKLDFRGSDIAQGGASQDVKIIEDIFNFLKPTNGKTMKKASDLVNFRTRTLAEEKLYKARNELTRGEGLLSSVDSDLLRLLRPKSKEYYDSTVEFAKTASLIEKFRKLLGDEYANEEIVTGKLGDFSRKLINRYSTDTKGKLKDLYTTLRFFDKTVDPNKELQKISDLVDLSDIVEKAVGKAPASSITGVIARGGEETVKAIADPKQAIISGFAKAIRSTIGKTPEEIEKQKIQVLKNLFKIK